ncbi:MULTISPECIES: sigma-70 family RNA polymerase sigma factor [Kamptonema]|uniref:sigma-70 family RNA polymerase sigma factor n=1 Tax=Kamptonema TaxID=1501433 RepID=UPI0001DAD187|nr:MULTISPECIES: sigma-70 family RNA polymerase sigma factor [Kamptonema]CBN55162.1 RNA polymerase sigma-E factor [Kamptonema sp. PCC 6506]
MLAVPTDAIPGYSDSYLIAQCLEGDRTCFRHLYRRYQNKVRSTLYQLCGQFFLDDLVQEVFLRVWKGLPKLKQRDNFSTWLYRITWNVAADQRQAFAQQRSFNSKLTIEENLSVDANSKISVDFDLMQIHYQDLVKRGLEKLSFEHRSVLVLHDLEDLPQKDVAQILGVPIGTVKSRLFRARATVREFLQQEGVQL